MHRMGSSGKIRGMDPEVLEGDANSTTSLLTEEQLNNGMVNIVVPLVVSPLCLLLFWNQATAQRRGLIERSATRWNRQTVWKYIIDIDLLGIILLASGMALFLLPFSLWSYQQAHGDHL